MAKKAPSSRLVWLALGLAILASCQMNPSGSTPQAIQVAGVVGGTETNPTLLGKPLDLQGASLTREGEPYSGPILPGMVVVAQGTDQGSALRLQSLEVQVELKGPIAALDVNTGTLTVLGQQVFTDANTQIYEKVGGSYRTLLLSDLRVGDWVEVQGTATQTGILATYIERYSAQDSQVELEGRATNLDQAAMRFTLNGYTVDYAQAQVVGTPTEGVWVEVKGTLSGTTVLATKVVFKTSRNNGYGASRRVELEGPILGLDPTNKTFQLLGYTVDYSQAQVVGTLTDGVYVEAKGQVDANNPTLFHAQLVKVKYPKSYPAKAEAKGMVSALDPNQGTFTIGNMGFYVDGNTLLKRDGPDGPIAFAEIRVGDYVEVRYDPTQTDADGRYYALKVEVKGQGAGEAREWEGAVFAVDRTAYTFQLLGYTVTTSPATRFEWRDQEYTQQGFFALLQDGDRVEVKGALSGTTITATQVELKRR
ncbi:DUF5666 domain-containing protein [Thermus caldifontis]|uniref:DUF5666 domain-containing protein n=1 Tax=Thermus caldifontis TaxID=1930763 RepID=UPI0013B4493A|nr:DUF5666 domain-containing protein [Thermus caldifontis]